MKSLFPGKDGKRRVMVDIETLGTGQNAHVLQIGIACFNGEQQKLVFETNVRPEQPNRTIDASTVMWWLQQSDEARSALRNGLAYSYVEAAHALHYMLIDADEIWARPASFDLPILHSFVNQGFPGAADKCMSYKKWRCASAILHLAQVTKEDVTDDLGKANPHSAAYDALLQASMLRLALNKLIPNWEEKQ